MCASGTSSSKSEGANGEPKTWRPGKDLLRTLSSHDVSALRTLGRTFVADVVGDADGTNETDTMDGHNLLFIEIRSDGRSVFVARSVPRHPRRPQSDPRAHPSPLERRLIALAASSDEPCLRSVAQYAR
jgi:hypothetical protein